MLPEYVKRLTSFNSENYQNYSDTNIVSIALTIALALGHRSRAGVISLEGEALHEQQDLLQHGSLANSYLQFHGPVEGPVFEVKVPYEDSSNHLHGHEQQQELPYALDYVAHPKYEFSYGVEDHQTGDFHAQKETRDGISFAASVHSWAFLSAGSSVSGQYSVKEPGGSVRVVRYRADKDGFHAVVHTSGKNDHSADIYAGQGQPRVHDHQAAVQQEQDVQANVYSTIFLMFLKLLSCAKLLYAYHLDLRLRFLKTYYTFDIVFCSGEINPIRYTPSQIEDIEKGNVLRDKHQAHCIYIIWEFEFEQQH
ncbi:Cuticle protein 8 [Melipona quadrifasciata]|uniref:Cuticle protein 8 n=1 Tax=Melipona quadrifasciata TaxID=166423 RepID=A0A0N0BGF9_9HYME|nr:Cuticle protein 8 [Melipona quadrifasciata]